MDGTQMQPSLSRRTLVFSALSAAGGLAIGIPLTAEAAQAPVMADGHNPGQEMTAWLIIDPDNTVTVRIPHQEMGQGTSTALAMLVAEELDCDWAKVRMEYASANRNQRAGGGLYKAMSTVGSQGVRTSVAMMQQAGASARERLRVAAAERWKVDPAQCSIASGKCLLKTSNQTLSYGELAPAAALIKLTTEPTIKSPDQYRYVGKWTARLDTPSKLDGSAQFGIDAKVPGMVYAALVSCPVFGGTLKSVDDAAVKAKRGVIAVVKLGDTVAVVADRYWRAKAALAELKIEWDAGAGGTVDSAQLEKIYLDALNGPLVEVDKVGDAPAALAAPGAKLVEAVYEAPMLAHATMEPLNCTVQLQPDRLDIWIGTQSPMEALKLAAKESGLAPENVYIHNHFLGGGFGRRSQPDEVVHAIALAKAVGKPVKVIWSREHDIMRDRYRPQAAVRFRAALGADGKATAFQGQVAVPSILRSLGVPFPAERVEPMATECIAKSIYTTPNKHVAAVMKNSHVPVMFWRGVGGSQNGFVIESFIDEMAHAAGQDPLQFRRAMVDRPDILLVLDTLAAKSGWGQPLPKGRGRGVAVVETYGSISGEVVEVTVSKAGELKVDRVVSAINCYNAVNPNTIEQQMQGGVIFALSAARYGEITIKDGAPEQDNFHTYQMVRMADTPTRIDVHLALSGGTKWGGIGEPGVAPLAPALCNAIFAATGKRIRKLPLKNADLTWA